MSWYGGHAIEERARAMFLDDMDHRDGVIVHYTADLRELYETLAEAVERVINYVLSEDFEACLAEIRAEKEEA